MSLFNGEGRNGMRFQREESNPCTLLCVVIIIHVLYVSSKDVKTLKGKSFCFFVSQHLMPCCSELSIPGLEFSVMGSPSSNEPLHV